MIEDVLTYVVMILILISKKQKEGQQLVLRVNGQFIPHKMNLQIKFFPHRPQK